MINRKLFYDSIRPMFGKISQKQVEGLDAILDAFEFKYSKIGLDALAYIFATVYHESATKMQPINEFGKGRGRDYGKKLKMSRKPYLWPDKLYYGRGFVQLTWFENYEKASKKLHIDCLEHPELVLELKNATDILFLGMIEGWFTTRKLSQYFTRTPCDFLNARAIINGKDKASLIKGYAIKFRKAIILE